MVMNFFSAFTGIGAFDLGLERAGWRCVGQCEIDPFCNAVLKKHWPNVWRHKNVKTLTGQLIHDECGDLDAFIGGPPCQPSSNAGERRGAADHRWLWPDYLRLVSEVNDAQERPLMWVLAENPRAVLSLTVDYQRFSQWIADQFAARGYELLPLLLAAEDVGAPHIRDRVWFLAYRPGIGRSKGQPEPTRIEGRSDALISGSPLADSAFNRLQPKETDARQPQSAGLGDVADSGRSERWVQTEGRSDDHQGADSGGTQAPGRPQFCGQLLADSDRSRQLEQGGRLGEKRRRAENGRSGELADSNGELRDGSEQSRMRGRAEHSDGRSERGDSDLARLALDAGERCDSREEFAPSLRTGWPARPGEPQHEWEEPRVIAPESQMGGAADGASLYVVRRRRVAALKGLGNAVVPQCAEIIGRAILESLL